MVTPSSDELRVELAALRPALLGYARRAVRESAVAEDLVQEAMTAALTAGRTFEGRARLRTWATAILAHKIADHFRATARAATVVDPNADLDFTVADGYRTPETHAARKQALSALSAALATLPELERLAVLSVDVEGLDHDAVSAAMQITANHLRVLLHRGRHKLRKAIEHAVL